MAIQVLYKLPEKVMKKSERAMIREDLQEAIDNGIEAFEFVGDYNYRYLASNVKNEANWLAEKMIAKVYEDHRCEFKNREFLLADSMKKRFVKQWITITGITLEDRKHVYCKINHSATAGIFDLLKEADENITRRVEANRARRKAQEEQG